MINKVTESTSVVNEEVAFLNGLSENTSQKSNAILDEIKSQNTSISYIKDQLRLLEEQAQELREFVE